MTVELIARQIQAWKNDPELSEREQAKLARLEAFQKMTQLETYIWDEIRSYKSIQPFVDLLRTMGVLCYPHLTIQNMEGTAIKADPKKGWQDEWIFEFDVNGKEEEFSLSPPKDGDFFEEILSAFNAIIRKNGLDSQFHRLVVLGDFMDEPTIEIGLIDSKILAKMSKKG